MNPALKATLVATAVGGAVPAALASLQSCGTDAKTLLVQCIAGAIVAIGALYVEKPKATTKSDDGTPDAGGN